MENNNYILSKNAIGIILIWIGPPLFYFIRSQFHLGGGTITSGVFYLLSLYLIRTPLNAKIGYKPNLNLLLTGGLFYILALVYFFVFNYNTFTRLIDTVNIFTTLIFFFLLLRVDNNIQKFLPFWILVLTIVLNIALIYSVINNPNYIIGQRATVQFGDEGFTGNPGTYARNGLFGFIISILFLNIREINLYKQTSIFAKLLAVLNIILSLVTIIITQTRMILLSLIIISLTYLFFVKKKNINNVAEKKYSKRLFLGFSILAIILDYIYNITSILNYYIVNYWSMFERAISTGFTMGKASSGKEVDASAMGRIENIKIFKNIFTYEKFNLLFGKGFNYRYMDIPILEVLINFGIFGLLIYLVFVIMAGWYSFRMLKSDSIFQIFLGLTFIQVFIGMCTSGRPMDIAYCIMYFVYIRFLAVEVK